MPALARSLEEFPLPADIFDVMQVAAGVREACQSASQETGQPVAVVVEAARFYVQQVLLRPDADPYRVLGLPPGASRDVARRHLGCLLQWLHPDVNKDLDSIYTDRVLKAWREISANADSSRPPASRSARPVKSRRTKRMPWIEQPRERIRIRPNRIFMPVTKRIVVVATAAVLVALMFAVYAIQPS
jgi:hypothetical protein